MACLGWCLRDFVALFRHNTIKHLLTTALDFIVFAEETTADEENEMHAFHKFHQDLEDYAAVTHSPNTFCDIGITGYLSLSVCVSRPPAGKGSTFVLSTICGPGGTN